jgi:arsenite methyltransferase
MATQTQTQDQWAQWILQQRHGGDPELLKAMMQPLFQIRDAVLQHAAIQAGNTVLDIGSGDGLIAFGALSQVGEHGKVIFSDISQDLLRHCQQMAQQMGVINRCQFVYASADHLETIPSQSIDVVTMRSVLVYVQNKPQAFQEFARVLKPGGRISLFEPVPYLMQPEPPNLFYGCDVTPIMDITDKLKVTLNEAFKPLMQFNERAMLQAVENAGFSEVYAMIQISIFPDVGRRFNLPPTNWQAFLKTALNPLTPPLEEILRQRLTDEEIARFTNHMRPLVENNRRSDRSAVLYLWSIKQ